MTVGRCNCLWAALVAVSMALPSAANARQPASGAGEPSPAPGLLDAPAQAAPLVPEESTRGPVAAQPGSRATDPRPSRRRRQPHAELEPESQPEPQQPAPEPRPARPERLSPERGDAEQGAEAAQPEHASATRQGKWTQWEDGRALWTCEFKDGKKHGKATRYFVEGEGRLFTLPVAVGFSAPFSAEATFVADKLDGPCTIIDAEQRTLGQLTLKADELEGECVWFYPSGERRELSHYTAGRLEGKRVLYDHDGQVTREDDYHDGRPTAIELSSYESGPKQMRGTYYLPGAQKYTRFDWVHGDVQTRVLHEFPDKVRTGIWAWWYENGQRQLEGHYEEDQPVGTWTWWYSTGQKQRQGEYADGLQSGTWNWWFANGQKQIEGAYAAGKATGKWHFWDERGNAVSQDSVKVAGGKVDTKQAQGKGRPVQAIHQAQPPRRGTLR